MPWPVEMPCNFTFDSFRHKIVTVWRWFYSLFSNVPGRFENLIFIFTHKDLHVPHDQFFFFFITCRDIYHLSLNVTKLLFFSVCI